MKRLMLVAAILSITFVTAQNAKSDVSSSGGAASLQNAANSDARFGSATVFYNPKRRTEGTFYLYDNWENFAVIHTNDDQRFSLKNINLNLKRNAFESKVSGDSIFTFNFNNIKKFVVNGKEFRNYYWNDDNRVYEVIYDGDDLQLLKGFDVVLVEGSANPMLNRANDRYIRKEYYFVREKGKIRKFKLKKKKILKLVGGNEAKADEILDYAKENRLSFSKENDVRKILEYSSNGRN